MILFSTIPQSQMTIQNLDFGIPKKCFSESIILPFQFLDFQQQSQFSTELNKFYFFLLFLHYQLILLPSLDFISPYLQLQLS